MATTEELYDDLCAEMPPDGGDMFGAEAAIESGGIVTNALLAWALKKAKDTMCEQRDEIAAVAQKFIDERVRNPVVAAVLSNALVFVLDQACPNIN